MQEEQLEYFPPHLNRVEKTLLRLGEVSSLVAVTTIRYPERRNMLSYPVSFHSYTGQSGDKKTVCTINSREFLVYRFRTYDPVNNYYKSHDYYFTALQVYSLRNAIKRCLDWLDDEKLFLFKYNKWNKHRDVEDCFVKVKAVNDKVMSVYPDVRVISDEESERVVYFQFSDSVYDYIEYEEAYNLYEYLANINLSQIAMNMLAILREKSEKNSLDIFEDSNNEIGINIFMLDAIISVMTKEKFEELEDLSGLDLSIFLKKGESFQRSMERFKSWLLNTKDDEYVKDRKDIYRILTKT